MRARHCSPACTLVFSPRKVASISPSTRTTPPPEPDPSAEKAFKKKAEVLAPRYRTELLQPGSLEAVAKPVK